LVASVSAVSKYVRQSCVAATDPLQKQWTSVTILDVSRMDDRFDHQAEDVGQDMACGS
jgi:hypothetical protein